MKYLDVIRDENEEVRERLELVMGRVKEIAENPEIKAPFADYFKAVAEYLLAQNEILGLSHSGQLSKITKEDGVKLNERLYSGLRKENYENHFANPAYAVKLLGEDYGKYLSSVFSRIIKENTNVFMGRSLFVCIDAELVVELYNYFVDDEELSADEIKNCLYSFVHDYAEVYSEETVDSIVNADMDYNLDIVMDSDLTDPSYVYRYGLFISEDELKSAEYLNTLSDEEIQAMADTMTEGYRIGFVAGNKDLSKKTIAKLIYPVGFERMARAAVKNFEKLNLKTIAAPFSTSANKQFDYDHKEDMSLWLDKAYVEYRIECLRNAFEKVKDIAPGFAGPAVIENFGEEPFAPEAKPENPKYSEKQQPLYVHLNSEHSQIINEYIHGEEESFTIIAYPVASIGDKYEEIFSETVKINTLDYILYRDMQQKIIDVLDTADRVHIVGANGNKTDLYVKIYDLKDAEKETAFENCVADVNIPVGEVFTSPVLEGTEGKLHVSQVYLNELNYMNLELDFEEGKIKEYTCTNFEDEAENKKYIKDNLLFHHDTLPMGEFAIGTNTAAYKMARVYDIAAKLPILIAEKTGPHFAVGDTCYTYSEDIAVYNPDGKEIVARDNSISILRKEDMSKAYFNCHTDITIPYDELGAITAIRKDGTTQDIIRDGRFVVPGTEELNKELDAFDAWKQGK